MDDITNNYLSEWKAKVCRCQGEANGHVVSGGITLWARSCRLLNYRVFCATLGATRTGLLLSWSCAGSSKNCCTRTYEHAARVSYTSRTADQLFDRSYCYRCQVDQMAPRFRPLGVRRHCPRWLPRRLSVDRARIAAAVTLGRGGVPAAFLRSLARPPRNPAACKTGRICSPCAALQYRILTGQALHPPSTRSCGMAFATW